MLKHTALTLVTFGALLALAPALCADVIRIDNIDRTVSITNIDEGLVFYRARGSEREVALESISAFQLTRYPEFAKAVALTEADPAKAADQLAKLVKKVREPYLKPLIHARRSAALDRAGRFAEALAAYESAVALDDHAYFIKRAPGNLPTDAAQRAAARKAVERLLADNDNDAVAERLNALLQKLAAAPPEKKLDQDAGSTADRPKPKPKPDPRPAETAKPAVQPIPGFDPNTQRQIKNLIDAKKYDQAVAWINRAIAAPRAPLADLYYQRGLAQAAMKKDVPAALSFLRTASLFPDHTLADDALLQAGAALKRAGKPGVARRVWAIGLERTKDAAMSAKFKSMIGSTPAP